jgi:hypothetical protein
MKGLKTPKSKTPKSKTPKSKSNKRTVVHITQHRKLKIEQHESH